MALSAFSFQFENLASTVHFAEEEAVNQEIQKVREIAQRSSPTVEASLKAFKEIEGCLSPATCDKHPQFVRSVLELVRQGVFAINQVAAKALAPPPIRMDVAGLREESSLKRETIFDRVVTIPKEFILDIPQLPPLCEELSGLTRGIIEIDRGYLYYEEEGQGIPLVLLNPGPGGTHHFFHPHFSCIKDCSRIVYYDARGTGQSSKDETGESYTIKQAVEDLECLRKALKIEKWAVLGWSFGGFLAQAYSLTYPERTLGIILVAAVDGLSKIEKEPERSEQVVSNEERGAITKVWAAYKEGKLSLPQACYNASLCGDWKRQHYYKPTNREMIREVLHEWVPAPGYNVLMCTDQEKIPLDGAFDDCDIPTLVAEGRWDLSFGVDKVAYMKKHHPHAHHEVFEKSAHAPFADEGKKFFSLLKEFLSIANSTEGTPRPGKRIQWPKSVSEYSRKLAIAREVPSERERDRIVIDCYEQALKDRCSDATVWVAFASTFIHSQDRCDKCLIALKQLEFSLRKTDVNHWKAFGYCIKAWQGHMLDLLGKRDEAIECYQEALKINNGGSDNYFEDGVSIDRKWLEARIRMPFTW